MQRRYEQAQIKNGKNWHSDLNVNAYVSVNEWEERQRMLINHILLSMNVWMENQGIVLAYSLTHIDPPEMLLH